MAEFKPSDLLVGVVDFFAILLSGAVLTFALQLTKVGFVQSLFENRSNEAKWIIFVIASYLLGCCVNRFGSTPINDGKRCKPPIFTLRC